MSRDTSVERAWRCGWRQTVWAGHGGARRGTAVRAGRCGRGRAGRAGHGGVARAANQGQGQGKDGGDKILGDKRQKTRERETHTQAMADEKGREGERERAEREEG